MLFQPLKRHIRKTLAAIIFFSVFLHSQSYQDNSTKISYPWQLEIAKKWTRQSSIILFVTGLFQELLDNKKPEVLFSSLETASIVQTLLTP